MKKSPQKNNNGKSIRKRMAISNNNWDWYAKLMTTGVDIAVKYADTPILGPFLKKLVFLDKPSTNFTQGYVVNINTDLSHQSQNVILPVEIMRKAIETSSFRSIMNKCLCRTGHQCNDYDISLGCVFIGKGATSTVERGLAREVTVEEALEHVDKAMGQGLVGQCLWVEAEKFVWGIEDRDLHSFLEICFCCPCCCLALRNRKHMTSDIKARFRNIGWKSVYSEGCNNCGICEDACPTKAITVEDGCVSISDQCFGCGICAFKCPEKSLEIQMIHQQKQTIEEYFQGFRPEL